MSQKYYADEIIKLTDWKFFLKHNDFLCVHKNFHFT